MQAGYDSMWGLFPSFLSGAHWITMAGGMIEGTLGLSYAKTVIDFEQVDAFYRFMQGCAFDDPDELLDTIREVGSGENTSSAPPIPAEATSSSSPPRATSPTSSGKEEGAKDSAAAGLEKAKRWLARYEPPPIDPARSTKRSGPSWRGANARSPPSSREAPVAGPPAASPVRNRERYRSLTPAMTTPARPTATP